MKFLVALSLIALASAKPQFGKAGKVAVNAAAAVVSAPSVAVQAVATDSGDYAAPILKSEYEANEQGYNYAYETGNGIAASAVGTYKKVDDQVVIVAEGGYQYTAPDGTPVLFKYVADENGYHVEGDLLPVAPPVPPMIARAIQWTLEHPAQVETNKKF